MAVFTAAASLGHPGFPEQPERLAAIYRRLVADGLTRPEHLPAPRHAFLTTGDPATFSALARRFLGPEVSAVARTLGVPA